MLARLVAIVLVTFLSFAAGDPPRNIASDGAPVGASVSATEEPRDLPGVHNLVCYKGSSADAFISGSAPEGTVGLDSLAKLGIKTIISVDGAIPDVAAAKARGVRYVHLPIGYDGFDDARKAELVRAVRDLPKPIYINNCAVGEIMVEVNHPEPPATGFVPEEIIPVAGTDHDAPPRALLDCAPVRRLVFVYRG